MHDNCEDFFMVGWNNVEVDLDPTESLSNHWFYTSRSEPMPC
jgi:hypothetical protein